MMDIHSMSKEELIKAVEGDRFFKEACHLRGKLEEVQRERDEALSKKVSDIIKEFALGEEFKSPSVIFQMAKDIDRLNMDNRREWVRAINYAIDDYKREYVGHGIETLFNDLAKRIESGEVEL